MGRAPPVDCVCPGSGQGNEEGLEERGINTSSLNGDQMRVILANHDDFKNETPRLTRFLESRGHVAFFLPKFHPKINPIERV